jgi:hypothetical protein
MRWLDTHGGWCAMVLAIICLIVWTMVLTGCDYRCPDPQPQPAPGVCDQLRSLGAGFLLYGGIGFGVGVVLRIVLFVGAFGVLGPIVAFLSRFGGIIAILASGGAVAVAVGAAFTWLAEYLWAVVLACVLAGLAWAWWHRAGIRRWLDRRAALGEKE